MMDEPRPAREAYAYTPLSASRGIRVVILEPSAAMDDPIRCRIEEISLDEKTESSLPYEALSYVWGRPVGSRTIDCSGGMLLVTPNCEAALRHLRLTNRERVLWIDAICIDQASASEKGVQVPLMGDVYAHAARVLIWLGPGSDGTSRLCENITRARRLTDFFEIARRSWWRFIVLLPLIRWFWCHVYRE